MARCKTNSRGMKPNGRGHGKEPFFRALHSIYDHTDYLALSKTARAFLWDLCRQYNGYNNGNISAAPGIMEPMGWNKKTALRCRSELEQRGWISVTRYPRAQKEPILYRLTWLDIDRWEGKPTLDPGVEKIPRRSLRR
ncbi:MAG: hypothetical protein VYE54_03635 [Pseudomonadota bacterium]|nr:hypothetical protein [Pseudomonadota bacterium]